MWGIFSCLSPHLLFCCVWFLLALILLFCSTFRRDSDYFLSFPLLSHVQVFSFEISFVCHLQCFPSHFYSCYFWYVDNCVVCIVSHNCNQFCSTLGCVMFRSLFCLINTILNAGKTSLPPPFQVKQNRSSLSPSLSLSLSLSSRSVCLKYILLTLLSNHHTIHPLPFSDPLYFTETLQNNRVIEN